CLPETRMAILDEIEGFIDGTKSDNTKRVILLTGGAGTGKSAIAHTIAERFDTGLRLGSSCFFDSTIPMRRDAVAVFRIIARDLASFDQDIKAKLWETIKENQAIRTIVSIREQFENFILKPTETLSLLGPIVIVMDAFDECDNREEFLEIFAANVSKLPDNFRFLLTARPEDDILQCLQALDCVHVMRMDESTSKGSTNEDIEKFIRHELQRVSFKLDRRWPNGSWVTKLVESSDGLFLWASTACSFIKPSRNEISEPAEQFNALVSDRGIIGNIDELYQKVLERKFHNRVGYDKRLSNFKTLMKKILAAKVPLSWAALNDIFNSESISEITEEILPHLGAFLTGTDEMTSPIQFLHFSFKEFLTNPTRGKQFYVGEDAHSANYEFALASLRLMNSLKADICSLRDPMTLNPPTEEIQRHIHNWESIAYACRFWEVHLEESDVPIADDIQVIEFLSVHVLHWIEALSLANQLSVASTSMDSISKVSVENWKNHLKLAADVKRMVIAFHPLVSKHCLQIYHSAMLFIPRNTELFKQYSRNNPLPYELLYPPSEWQALLCTMEGHSDVVTSVVFSPHGDRLASCSLDGTVRFWDSQTGKQIGEAMTGHTNWVNSVVFSPQGDRLASCSDDNTVRLWDVQTGKQIGEAMTGHTDPVNSVVFSPQGDHLASCSNDGTVRLWDSQTGKQFGEAMTGHTDKVNSVVFSPQGDHLASCSNDGTVRLWNSQAGKQNGQAMTGHTGSVNSVVFSPQGDRLASCSDDHTVRLWDLQTGEQIGGAMTGHTGSVLSVVFSPQGDRLATCSADCTVCFWDSQTGKQIGEAMMGHTDFVSHIVFSPQGDRLASCSHDNTVRLWDSQTGKQIGETMIETMTGHTGSVNSVVFSPQGDRLATGSHDHTVCLWDSQTGKQIGEAMTGHTDPVNSVVFSSQGNRLASCAFDSTVRFWDLQTGKQIAEAMTGNIGWVECIVFSPQGDRLASGSSNGKVCLWDSQTGKQIGETMTGHTDSINSVVFSPQGDRLATCSYDGTVCFWDSQTGKQIGEAMTRHTNQVNSIVFSPQGDRLASCSNDNTVRLWDSQTGKQIGDAMAGHIDAVTSVVFSPQ
ncbi:hypothetical protein M422DRAFT_111641, partial [Sphaerobolus stellatus SS14]